MKKISEQRITAKSPKNKFRLFLTFFGVAMSMVALTITTLAWFLSTRHVGANIGEIVVEDEYAHEFSLMSNDAVITDSTIEFDAFYPGHVHRKSVEFSLTNFSKQGFTADLYFEAPEASDEAPFIDTEGKWGDVNYFYYLGSQIALTKVELNIEGTTPNFTSGEGNFLVETSSAGVAKGQVSGVATAISEFSRVYLFAGVEVPASKTLTGTLEFTFVDNGTDQSMYYLDWPDSGVTKRSLDAFLYRGV